MVVVGIDVAVDLVRHLPRVAVRDLARDRGDQPEAERRQAQQQEDQEEGGEAELADPAPAPVRSGSRLAAFTAEQAADLLEFLRALTDEELLRDRKFGNPWGEGKN